MAYFVMKGWKGTHNEQLVYIGTMYQLGVASWHMLSMTFRLFLMIFNRYCAYNCLLMPLYCMPICHIVRIMMC